MSKSFTVRVAEHREAPEGKVEVCFTNRKPPEKPKKGKGGACGPCFYDPWTTSVDLRLPMSQDDAETMYPVGHLCKVTLGVKGSGSDGGSSKPKGRIGRLKAAAEASKRARAEYEDEGDED